MRKNVKKLLYLVFIFLMISSSIIGQTVYNATNGKKTITTCVGTFYDSGGSVDNYSINESDTVIFMPGTAGKKVSLTFTSFNIEEGVDLMTIYDGKSVTSTLLNEYTGTTSPGTVTATNADGALTVVFYSDGSETMAGWAATISCIDGGSSEPMVSTFRTKFTGTSGIVFDDSNNMYVSRGSYITKITPDGTESVYAEGMTTGNFMAFDKLGNLYCCDYEQNKVYKIPAGGGAATNFATVYNPSGIVYSPTQDVLYVIRYLQAGISKITMAGVVSNFTAIPEASRACGLTMDNDSNFYTTDFMDSRVYKIAKDANVSANISIFATGTNGYISIDFLKNSNFFLITDYTAHKIMKVDMQGVTTTYSGNGTNVDVDGVISTAQFAAPYYAALDKQGNYYVTGYYTKNIRKISNVDGPPKPFVSVSAPVLDEYWKTNTVKAISWNSYSVKNVDIFYSLDNGTKWNKIASNASSSDSKLNTYNWTIPDSIKGTYTTSLIKVQNADGSLVSTSKAFTLSNLGPLYVSKPKKGEVLNAASTYVIQYGNRSAISATNQSLYVSYDGTLGSLVQLAYMGSVSKGTFTYNWSIPVEAVGTKCKIALSDPDMQNYVLSEEFTIQKAPPVLKYLSNPATNSYLRSGTTTTISWYSISVDTVDIWYSVDGGSNWISIQKDFLPHNNSYSEYNWNIPAIAAGTSTNCLVKVSSKKSPSTVYTISGIFTISNKTQVEILNPISTTVAKAGEPLVISYRNNGRSVSSYFYVYYSVDSSRWNSISYFYGMPTGEGSFTWNVDRTIATDETVYVAVSQEYPTYVSNYRGISKAFKVVGLPPHIAVKSPVSGDYLTSKSKRSIEWESINASNYVKIEYSTNNGRSWNNVTESANNSNSENLYYSLNVPSVAGKEDSCFIRVIDNSNPLIGDTSEMFTISNKSQLRVVKPVKDEVLQAGNNYSIVMNNLSKSIESTRLYYLYNGSLYSISYLYNVGSGMTVYNWSIPNSLVGANNYQIVVKDNVHNTYDTTEYFTIKAANPAIKVTSPTIGSILWSNDGIYLYYNSVGVANVDIHYSLDGQSWVSIAKNQAASGSYYTTVPQVEGTKENCYFRVRSSLDTTTVFSISPVFTIKNEPTNYTILKPNGGETYKAGETVYIEYYNSGRSNTAYLTYSLDNGAGVNITSTTSRYGKNTTSWYIPVTTQKSTARIIVSNNSTTTDTSDLPFNILPADPYITLSSPASLVWWVSGRDYTVNFNSLNVDSAILEYSVDAGTTWKFIDTIKNIANGKNSISIKAPAVENTSKYAQLRLTKKANAKVYGTSAIFTLSNTLPVLKVVSPNGGEVFKAGNSFGLTVINESNNYAYGDILMSVDSGLTWMPKYNGYYFKSGKSVVSITIDYYAETTNDVLVKVVPSDANNFSGDQSDAVFTINAVEPYISVYSPGAGSLYWSFENLYIRWYSVHVENVNIELSTDNKKTWEIIETNISCENGYNSFDWYVPSIVGKKDSCFFRITSSGNNNIVGISNIFAISNQASVIAVTKPNGGESYSAGNSIRISYTYNGRPREYNTLYLSYDGGKSKVAIGNDYGISNGNNYYDYYIPADVKTSTNCFVYVVEGTNVNPAKDSSNNKFTINEIPPSISVTTPAASAYLVSGSISLVEWQGYKVNSVNINYSTDGITWNNIASNVASVNGYNSYSIIVPDVNGTFNNTFIKVYSTTPSVSGVSKAFTLTNVPVGYTVTWPNGKEILQAGKSYTVNFTKTGPKTNDYVTIYLSTDGGNTYSYLSSMSFYKTGTGQYKWTVDKYLSGKYCKIKVSSSESLSDESDNNFEIAPAAPSIEITSPIANANWTSDGYQIVNWNSVSVDKVNLQYSLDAGASWKNVAVNIASYNGKNSFGMMVPTVEQTEYNAKIRVIVQDSSVYDISSTFIISPVPATLTVLNPNGGEVLKTGTTCFVKYDYTGPSTGVNILASPDGGITWINLGSSTISSGTNSFEWSISDDLTLSNYYRVKVVTNDGNVFDISNKIFSVVSGKPAITITSPNSGDYFVAGTDVSINWNAKNVDNVNIDYSLDGGETWNNIVSNLSISNGGNSQSWSVPSVSGTMLNSVIKITSVTDSKVFDLSENFVISDQPRSITVISPNGGETLNAGKYYNIEFSNNGPKTTARIDLISEGQDNIFLGWYQQTQNGNNKVELLIPEVAYGNTLSKIRVSDYYADNIFDESNAVFTIVGVAPYIKVTSPDTGSVWSIGDVKTIIWKSYNIDSVDIEYSIDGGTTWKPVASNIKVENGENTYEWTVDDIKTTLKDAFIRVKNSKDITIFDLSEKFKLVGTPISIAVLYPNGGDTIKAGTELKIKYKYTGDESLVDIYISSDSGRSYTELGSKFSQYGDNEYSVTVPYDATLSAVNIIKVEDAAGINDFSDKIFSIVAADPSLKVQNPIAGSYWITKTTQSISWFSWGVAKVKIEYSIDSGKTYTQIRDRVPSWNGNNKFNWTVPSTITGDKYGRLRVTESTTAAQKAVNESPAFTLTDVPVGFTITAPVVNAKLQAGTTDTVRFNYAGPWSEAAIYLSADSGSTWVALDGYVSIKKGANKAGVQIPIETPASKVALIRIDDINNPSVSKTSELFEITSAPPTIAIVKPVEKAYWVTGTIQSIVWKSYSVEKVKLEYSLDGTSWTQIKTNVPSKDGENQFNWKVNAAVTSAVKSSYIRVSSVASASVNGKSVVFTISNAYPSNDAKLSALNVAGTLISGFDARVFEYTYNIAYSATQKPAVTVTTSDSKASYKIENSILMPGYTTVTVTAEDGTTTLTYNIMYKKNAAGTVSTLSDIKANGTTVAGFNATTYIYNVQLAVGTTTVPAVIATATDKNATVKITNAAKLPGKTTILVTSEDGLSKKTYEVNFTVKVGIAETAEVNVEMYPNPVLDKLQITNVANSDIFIYNFNGQLVKEVNCNEATTEVDMSGYYPGIYFVKVVNGGSAITRKIEKIK